MILRPLLHLLIILTLAVVVQQVTFATIHEWFANRVGKDLLAIGLGFIIAAYPSSKFISELLRNLDLDNFRDAGLASAGQAIGILERWLVLIFVLNDEFIGIGFLLAGKSIFRIGDLTTGADRKHTEYILLGTLLSVTIAIMIALGIRYLLSI